MKLALTLLLFFASVAHAQNVNWVLTWPTQPRPNSSISNVPGENGEHMAVWIFQWQELYVWQPGNGWWSIAQYQGYSATGAYTASFDKQSLTPYGFDPSEGYYIYGSVKPDSAWEWQVYDRQAYSAWQITYFGPTDNSKLDTLPWNMVD